MWLKINLFTVFLLFSGHLFSQSNEKKIDTVFIFDSHMNLQKKFTNIRTLSKSEIQKNTDNFSDLLRFQAPVFIRENGRGGAASISFRGTTAQQTAFVWNGININSAFLGQGDVNNIGYLNADEIEIKPGGGSVIYGSGAIGGSVHLNNRIQYNQGFHLNYLSSLGSFDSFHQIVKTSFSDNQLSVLFSGNYNISKNDYQVPEKKYTNLNGQFYNTDISFSFGYKIKPHHQLSWITEFYNGMQHFPIFETSQTPTQYGTENTRSLLAWDWNERRINNSLKLAYTEENFSFYSQPQLPKSSGGKSENYIVKNDFKYSISPVWKMNFLSEFQNNRGVGFATGISEVNRNVLSLASLIRFLPQKKWSFETGLKKDFVENLKTPFLYSFSAIWEAWEVYQTGINFSKNFRYPTFNDLYWNPGGNPHLLPETSYQLEWKNRIGKKEINLSITPYYISISQMIRWLPTSKGYWEAFNVDKVSSSGLEAAVYLNRNWKHSRFQLTTGYSYTQSIDENTKKQLPYIPLHKIFGSLDYHFRFLEIYLQGVYNSRAYTDSAEENSLALSPYFLMNAGFNIEVLKHFSMGFKVNNLFNEVYSVSAYYFMPKRNYNIHFNIHF